MNQSIGWNDSRFKEILSLLHEMQQGSPSASIQPDQAGAMFADGTEVDPVDALLDQVRAIHGHYMGVDSAYAAVEQRLADMMDTIMAIAGLDFTRKAMVADRGDVIDAIALGLNMLGEELHATYVSNSYVDNIIHTMLDTLIVVIPDGSIKLLNNAALDLLGYHDYEVVGKDIEQIFLPTRYDAIAEQLNQEKVLQSIEEIYVTKEKKQVPVLLSGAQMHNEEGQLEGFVFVAQDITERKAAQIELEQAKDAAEMVARAKSQFLANMSHEIRTPLNGIIGMTNLLSDMQLTESQREQADIILRSSNTLLDIINNVLDFSKIEAGKIDLEEQPFILTDCIEDCLDLVATKAAKKNLDIVYDIEQEAAGEVFPRLIGDITRIRQIVVNLLGNAVKFTSAGEIIIRATVQPTPSQRYMSGANQPCDLIISVQDSGIGIPDDQLDHIFDSFQQADASTTRRYGGTGLGLSICKLLCETMGGRIWVESQQGRGSTFHFTVRVAKIPVDAVNVVTQQHLHKLMGKSILIVEDNETVCDIVAKWATRWKMDVTAVRSGAEALTRFESGQRFDICLVDSQLSDQSGYTLIKQIGQNRDYSDTRLILMKAVSESTPADIQERTSAVVNKPLKLRSLITSLSDAFTVSGQAQPTTHRTFDDPIAQTNPLRILLAEDNIVNQKVALLMLKRFGYAADIAANGLEAIDALKRQPYDVILMDIQMPEMDGIEATRHILAEWDTTQRPRIIAMTANALQGDRERLLAEGMDDYVSKPISPEALENALSQIRPLAGTKA